LVGWIRIRIEEGKNDQQKLEKVKKFMFLCTFDVLHGGLGIKFKKIKTLDPDPELDSVRFETNAPHCLKHHYFI
jgi:hypothetical protein